MDVSYTVGKHAMKFGASYNRYTKNQKLFLNAEGSFTFSGATGRCVHGHAAGLASGYSESQAAPIRHYVNQTPSVVCDGYLEGNASPQPATRAAV